MNAITIMKGLCIVGLVLCVAMMFWKQTQLVKTSEGKEQIAHGLKPKNFISTALIGLIANFFDTLGIGSFAPSSSAFKFTKSVDDLLVPGTLNVGDTVPVCVEAILFFEAFNIDPLTCALMCITATVGAFLGASIVSKWDRTKVRWGFGIGLFICLIAMKTAGIIVDNSATLISLVKFRDVPFHTAGICAVLALAGTLFTAFLLVKGFKGSILFGILFTWGLGMLAQVCGVYVPDPAGGFFSLYPDFSIKGLAQNFSEFGNTFGALFNSEDWTHTQNGVVVKSGWSLIKTLDFFVVMFAFFFVDLFDTLGTLIGVSMKGGFLDKQGRLPRISGALCADSIATSVGAVFGTSTTTTFVESASGVMAGGKTGLTAVTSAALFALAIIFAPVFLAIPGFATAPALIIVGYMMLSSCADVNWGDAGEAVPAFLAVAAMPFTYSISDGIMFGVIAYTVINGCAGNFKRIHWIMYILTALFVAKYALM